MSQADIAFRINAPSVVARVMDGEAILIAFDTGSYYSSPGSGGFIIESIQSCGTIAEIAGAFAASEAWPRAAIEREVTRFVHELLAEALVAELDETANRAEALQQTASEAPVSGAVPRVALEFTPPHLEKYSDLEDLLVLDPIHDVDAAGWPIAKTRG